MRFTGHRRRGRGRRTLDSLTAALVRSKPGRPWYSQMCTVGYGGSANAFQTHAARPLTERVDFTDDNLPAARELRVEVRRVVNALVVVGDERLVLLDVLGQHLVLCKVSDVG